MPVRHGAAQTQQVVSEAVSLLGLKGLIPCSSTAPLHWCHSGTELLSVYGLMLDLTGAGTLAAVCERRTKALNAALLWNSGIREAAKTLEGALSRHFIQGEAHPEGNYQDKLMATGLYTLNFPFFEFLAVG